ncbi:M2 family metallopeptidase [Thalassotalea sp. Y01]|uniref:M2 family metallopeptidase n=1 Tax=Thalassotalea sp. Y01 TaxID=2729613 RepID=UPI00145E087C|nr:M2 family metallopeptidase [Thalassotalea sp. Y01]NMP16608.1 M2 family metallopeptidase [Thalassotalea sp. Y01]
MKLIKSSLAIVIASALATTACSDDTDKVVSKAPIAAKADQSTQADTLQPVAEFLVETEQEMTRLINESSKIEWVYQNFITEDTAALAASAGKEYSEAGVRFALQAAKYDGQQVSAEQRRKLDILKQALVLPAPQDSKKSAELAKIASDLGGMYGKGTYTNEAGETFNLGQLSKVLAESRDYDALLEAWRGWRTVSPEMKPLFEREVKLANEGAQGLGYSDLGAMWRSNYDMPADEFGQELDRLWGQVKPLYDALHCHVRAKLGEHYGEDKVPQGGPIPAHLLGNMWAQSWGNVYDLVAPENADPGYDVTQQLLKHNYSELDMVKGAENFFTSLGFAPLPDTFWQRSLFTKPQDRDVVCHASAWNLDSQDDIRIKMCIQKTGEEFSTIHHELGHNVYQRAYKVQSVLFQNSANDGFHEAIGDTIALSVTPAYLKEIGLIDTVPDASKDIGLLMKMALEKVAFIPFGLLVDQWRWKVFNGEVTAENYNTAWWQLRQQYQGVGAPIARAADDFDPGAKYHVPGNVPYSRYFLAHILQFEFHKALCEVAGYEGPINRCSIYNNKEAGAKLNQVLEMGSSQPWQQAHKILTGSEQMDASAILDYFAPLKAWLDQQNQGRQCGF